MIEAVVSFRDGVTETRRFNSLTPGYDYVTRHAARADCVAATLTSRDRVVFQYPDPTDFGDLIAIEENRQLAEAETPEARAEFAALLERNHAKAEAELAALRRQGMVVEGDEETDDEADDEADDDREFD